MLRNHLVEILRSQCEKRRHGRWSRWGEVNCLEALGHNVNRTHGVLGEREISISRNLACPTEWMVQPSPETDKDKGKKKITSKLCFQILPNVTLLKCVKS